MPAGEIAPWMALEWLEGETLEEVLLQRRGQGGQTPAEVLTTFRPILQAFAYAHRQGIAHRDIKPANIMAVPSEHGVTMRVLDFGIAKLVNPEEAAGIRAHQDQQHPRVLAALRRAGADRVRPHRALDRRPRAGLAARRSC